MIFTVLNEAKAVLGEQFVFLNKAGTCYILPWGSNQQVFSLSQQDFVIATQNQISLDQLTTKVIITGKGDNEGRTPVTATLEGETQYGVLQEIVPFTRGSSFQELKQKGEAILKEQGKPAEQITMTAPDIPSLRKGDLLHVQAGNLIGDFFVIGVIHQADKKQMVVTLERKNEG